MRARRPLIIVLEGRDMLVRGPGSRELLMTVCNGRPPFYSRSAKAWTVQAKRLADVLALADRLNYDVRISPDVEVEVGPLRDSKAGARGFESQAAGLQSDRVTEDLAVRGSSRSGTHSTVHREDADPGEGLW